VNAALDGRHTVLGLWATKLCAPNALVTDTIVLSVLFLSSLSSPSSLELVFEAFERLVEFGR